MRKEIPDNPDDMNVLIDKLKLAATECRAAAAEAKKERRELVETTRQAEQAAERIRTLAASVIEEQVELTVAEWRSTAEIRVDKAVDELMNQITEFAITSKELMTKRRQAIELSIQADALEGIMGTVQRRA